MHQYAEKLLSTPGIDKLGPVRNMLRLEETHGKENLDKACKRACHFKFNSYREVKGILENKLESEPLKNTPKPEKTQPSIQSKKFNYSRDPKEYKRKLSWDEAIERAYPISKYGAGIAIFGSYHAMQYDQMIEDLIKEEDRAVAEGRVGPLNGVKPKISEAWLKYHDVSVFEKNDPKKEEEINLQII